jgi:hypothetical protein
VGSLHEEQLGTRSNTAGKQRGDKTEGRCVEIRSLASLHTRAEGSSDDF